MNHKQIFLNLYTIKLIEWINKDPSNYSYGVESVPLVAEKMVKALAAGTANKDSRAIWAVCKELGVKYTYVAIKEYLKD